MASSAADVAAAAGLWAEPYLWASIFALFLGLAGGFAARAFLPPRRGRPRAGTKRRASLQASALSLRGRRSGRIAASIAWLSLAILALAAFLVLPGRPRIEALLKGGEAGAFYCWLSALALVALLGGFRPLLLGLPLAALLGAAFSLLGLGLSGWLPLRSSSPVEIARLLAYEIGPASIKGQLEMAERDSAPIVQDVRLASATCALQAESLSLDGPLGFLAELSLKLRGSRNGDGTRESGADMFRLTLYRVLALAAPGAADLTMASPAHEALVDALVPPLQGGEEASGAFGLAARRRSTSPAVAPRLLEPLVFGLGPRGEVSILK
jgi:hypothetical protein